MRHPRRTKLAAAPKIPAQFSKSTFKNATPSSHEIGRGAKRRGQFRKSTRKNAAPSSHEIGRGAKRRGQVRAPPVSRFCAWICEIARQFSTECCNCLFRLPPKGNTTRRRFYYIESTRNGGVTRGLSWQLKPCTLGTLPSSLDWYLTAEKFARRSWQRRARLGGT